MYRGPAFKIRGAWRVWVEVNHDPDLLLGEWQLSPPGGVLVGVAPGGGGGGGRAPGPVSAGPRGTDGLEGPDRQRVGTRTVRLGRLCSAIVDVVDWYTVLVLLLLVHVQLHVVRDGTVHELILTNVLHHALSLSS